MKRGALLAAAAVLVASAVAYAKQNDAGCGVGSLIFKDNEPVQQILAATTNGTFGNQTFGITTGTLGCDSGGLIKTSKAQENFVTANWRDLSKEIAAGGGEYVDSLASLMGCSKAATPDFARFAQSRYEVLFPARDTAPQAMLKTLRKEMAKDATLATSCSLL